MIRKHIYVMGRVQGVGFRFFAQRNAAVFHLSGYVQNLDNGMVELEIQGEPEDVEKFLLAVSRGTTWIQPERIWQEDMPVVSESGFYRKG